jgi:hypothetical protein
MYETILKHSRGILIYSFWFGVCALVFSLVFFILGFWVCGPPSPNPPDADTTFWSAVFFGPIYVIWFPFSIVSYLFELIGLGSTLPIIIGLLSDLSLWGALIYGSVRIIRYWLRHRSYAPDASYDGS